MTKSLYWNAYDSFEQLDPLLEWVSKNVEKAIEYFWEEEPPFVCFDVAEDGKILLTVWGPGKPTEDDPDGDLNNYTQTFDLMEQLEVDSRHDKTPERAAALRKLAADILALAVRTEESI